MPTASPRFKRVLLTLSICVNLGVLGFFKYFNFFVDSVGTLLEGVGLHADVPTLSIILPLGISFYTFQTLSYTVDVYRGHAPATRDFISFALFVAYFPQLVAGPIERATRLLPQLQRTRRLSIDWVASGVVLFLIGLTRKVVIADNVAPLVDRAFADPAGSSSAELLVGVILFGIQIYADFSGYSDMARGISRMLGIELMENFHRPYFATNITTFWRRWHVSLSSWLRDYLYIPLGGNRKGTRRTYINLMVTMLLGGLWHGAAWTFVIWGGIHGLALAVHKRFSGQGVSSDRTLASPSPGRWRIVRIALSWLATMCVVWVAWIFFRSPDIHSVWGVFAGLIHWHGSIARGDLLVLVGAIALLLVIDLPQEIADDHTVMLRWPAPVLGASMAAMILLCILLRRGDEVPFIYFQF